MKQPYTSILMPPLPGLTRLVCCWHPHGWLAVGHKTSPLRGFRSCRSKLMGIPPPRTACAGAPSLISECGDSSPLFHALTCQRVRLHRNQLR
jgi:hypothetical protein